MSQSTANTLEDGPMLDDEVYRLVFGDPEANQSHIAPEFRDAVEIPQFSRRINFAWDALEELQGFGWTVSVNVNAPAPYVAEGRNVVVVMHSPAHGMGIGWAPKAPLAICRAIVDASQSTGFQGFRS